MSCNNCSNESDCSCSTKTYTVAPTVIEPTDNGAGCSACDQEITSQIVTEGGPSTVADNAGQSSEMSIVGTKDGKFVKFPADANGFIRIVNGIASLITSFPQTVTNWFHTNTSDPTSEPLDVADHVVADQTGVLHLIRGRDGEDSVEMWDGTIQKWVVTPVTDLPIGFTGRPQKVESVELLGLSTVGHQTTPIDGTTQREAVVLKGDGIVAVRNFSNGDPENPTSVASVIPPPDDSSNAVWLLAYTFGTGYYMLEADSLGGNGGNGGSGANGADGSTPTIGANGNWFIDGVDTGQPSRGLDGVEGLIPTIGANGNWFLGGVDTLQPSQGADGVPAEMPSIGANGNWFLGLSDTGVPADASAVTLDTDAATAEVTSVLDAVFVGSQDLNTATEAPINLTSTISEDAWTSLSGAPVMTFSGTDYHRITFEAGVSYVGSLSGVAPILQLYKGAQLVAESRTGYQSGASGNNTSTNHIRYTDTSPGSSGVYTLVAKAGSSVVGGTTNTLGRVTCVAHKRVPVITSITLS